MCRYFQSNPSEETKFLELLEDITDQMIRTFYKINPKINYTNLIERLEKIKENNWKNITELQKREFIRLINLISK